jgi:ABC-type sulfate/molybdate transport systems ATPase subunit
VTAILVTHDAEDARIFAEDVAVMSAGRLIASGTPAVIFGSAVAE